METDHSGSSAPSHTPQTPQLLHPRETSPAVLSWRQQQALALMGWDGSEFLLGHTGAILAREGVP